MSGLQTVNADLLLSATVTGDGPTYDNVVPMYANAIQLEITGTATRVVVSLKGLINGSTFDTLAVLDTDQGYLTGEIVTLQLPAMVKKVKCSLDTLNFTGAQPTVTAHFAGSM